MTYKLLVGRMKTTNCTQTWFNFCRSWNNKCIEQGLVYGYERRILYEATLAENHATDTELETDYIIFNSEEDAFIFKLKYS